MNKIDILETEIPNVCFSKANELPKGDERIQKFKSQRIERGFDDSELWNLHYTFAQFIVPRLKAYKEHPGRVIDLEILNKIIESFEMILDDSGLYWNHEELDKFENGMILFAKNFNCLWN